MNRRLLWVIALLNCWWLSFGTPLTENRHAPLKPKIVVGATGDYPPFDFISPESGKHIGFDVDLFDSLAKEIGIEYEIRTAPWSTLVEELNAGKIDMTFSILYVPEKSSYVKFTTPHYLAGHAIVSRKGDPYNSMDALTGKKIAVLEQNFSHRYFLLHKNLNVQLVPVTHLSQAVQKVLEGECDATLLNSAVAYQIIKNLGCKNQIQLTDSKLDAYPLSFIIGEKNDQLLYQLNSALYKLKINGIYNQLHGKWLGLYDMTQTTKMRTFYIFLAIVLTILVLTTIFVVILRIQVRKAIARSKKSDEERDSTQRYLNMAIETGNVAVWGYDIKKGLIYNLSGRIFKEDELPVAEANKLIHPDDLAELETCLNRLLRGESLNESLCVRFNNPFTGQYEYTRKDITAVHAVDGTVTQLIGTHHNVTQELLHNQEKERFILSLNMAVQATHLTLFYYNIPKKCYYILQNNEFIKTRSEHETVLSHIHPDDKYAYNSLFNKLLSGEETSGHLICRVRDLALHQYKYFEFNFLAVHDYKGQLYQIAGSQKDVDLQLTREIEQKESKLQTDMAIATSDIVQWSFDCESGLFTTINAADSLTPCATGADCLRITHPDNRQEILRMITEMEKRYDATYNIDVRMKLPNDDQWHYITISGTAIKNSKGEVIRYTGFKKDNTKFVKLNDDLIRTNVEMDRANTVLKNILDQIPCALFIKDITNDYTYYLANDEFASFTHLTHTSIIGKNDYDLFGRDQAEKFRQDDEQAALQEGQILTLTETMPWQPPLILQTRKAVFTTADGHRLLIGISTNITERERILHELQEAKKRAEQSNTLKSAFLANMSHEIRTPLNAIVGFSELLKETDDPRDREKYWTIIDSNNDLLLRLIGDILDLSRIEAGSIGLTPVRFDAVPSFETMASTLRPRFTNPDVQFITENPYKSCWVELDEKRLNQIMINFVTNALKFTVKGSVKIGYRILNGGIRVYCSDTGVGIPADKLDHIFDRFFKGHEFAQGTGLGMAISKAIVDAQRGKIGVESKVGEGTTFWAWLPCQAEITLPDPNASSDDDSIASSTHIATTEAPCVNGNARTNNTHNERTKILIAEDNDSNYTLLKHILTGYDITRAVNGQDAVSQCENGFYRMILMDMKMPLMDGLEATRQIRTFDTQTPIIAVTANAFDSDRQAASQAGCNGFITKPLKRTEVLAVIKGEWRPLS